MPSALELTLLLLAASVLAVAALRLLNLPPVFGYLLVGIAVGPHTLALAPDSSSTYRLAEFGVVFPDVSRSESNSRCRGCAACGRSCSGSALPQVLITLAVPLALGPDVRRAGRGSERPARFALGAALAMFVDRDRAETAGRAPGAGTPIRAAS